MNEQTNVVQEVNAVEKQQDNEKNLDWIDEGNSKFAVVGHVDPKLIEGMLTHVKKDGRVCVMKRTKLSDEEIAKREEERKKKREALKAKNKEAQDKYREMRDDFKKQIKEVSKEADKYALERDFVKVQELDAQKKALETQLQQHLNQKTWRDFL